MTRRARKRFERDLAEYMQEATLRGVDAAVSQRALGNVEIARDLAQRNPPPRSMASLLACGLIVSTFMVCAIAYAQSAVRLGTFSNNRHSAARSAFQDALERTRIAKGVTKRTLFAQVLEPIYFVRAHTIDDIRGNFMERPARSTRHP